MNAPAASAPTAAASGRARRSFAEMSPGQLFRWRFSRHRLAVASLLVLGVLYSTTLLAEFVAPHASGWRNLDRLYCPPQPPRFSLEHGLHTPAVHRFTDPVTLRSTYWQDPSRVVPLGLFVRGEPYRLLGLFPANVRLIGVDTSRLPPDAPASAALSTWYLLGADRYGQDIFSRIIHGARISLSIGVVAIAVTFVLGIILGGISGYCGGTTDNLIQRAIEVVNAFPSLPLWMAIGAALPRDWSALQAYFAITVVLALLGWTGLARVVRGKILALREEDYAMAARLLGASHPRILFRHLLPGFTSHIIVSLTMAVPGMILGETALSFLGLGLRPPVVSWGVMLQDCLSLQTVANYPWLLTPVGAIILTVLGFNFLGDGLRDAADPHASRG